LVDASMIARLRREFADVVARYTVAGTLAAGRVPELDALIERYGTDAVARLVRAGGVRPGRVVPAGNGVRVPVVIVAGIVRLAGPGGFRSPR